MTDHTAWPAPAADGDDAEHGLEVLTDEVLPALIARLRASRLGELEVRTGDWRIRLRRDPRAALRAVSTAETTATVGSTLEAVQPELDGGVARSTAVGYFTPSNDLAVGRIVEAGDVLGVVDVLGISQDVTAPEDGIIASVLAEEGQAVEYGQALAQLERLEIRAEDEGEPA